MEGRQRTLRRLQECIAKSVKWTISPLESSPARGSALMSSATWASKIVTNDRD